MFQKQWTILEDELYTVTAKKMKYKFTKQVGTLKKVLEKLIENLVDRCSKSGSDCSESKALDSDSNFELAEMVGPREVCIESPFKAMLTYLRKYLDPTVSSQEFEDFFSKTEGFSEDGVKIKLSDTYILCEKQMSWMKIPSKSYQIPRCFIPRTYSIFMNTLQTFFQF